MTKKINARLKRQLEDDKLIARREKLLDFIEKDKTPLFLRKFYELLEIERELTLKEDR